MICYLKSSGAGEKSSKKKTSGICTASPAMTPAPTPVPTAAPTSVPTQASETLATTLCTIKANVKFEGNDLPKGEHAVTSLDQCAILCVARLDCTHFSMSAGMKCFLKSSGATEEQESKKKTSGVCRGSKPSKLPTVAPKPVPTCTIEKGIDYKGRDIADSATSVATVDDCADLCLANEQCSHFTMNSKKVCYLKTSGAGVSRGKKKTSGKCRDEVKQPQQPQPTKPAAAATSAPTTPAPATTAPSAGAGCTIVQSMNYEGFDLKNGISQVDTVSVCADRCMTRSGCTHFTVSSGSRGKMKCFLKYSNVGAVADKKKTSGACRAVPTQAPNPTCTLKPGTDFVGSDISGYTPKYAKDFAQCADRCLAHKECTHFTISGRRRCFLKTSGAGETVSSKGTSGICTPYDPRGVDVPQDTPTVGGSAEQTTCELRVQVDFKGNDLARSSSKVNSTEECESLCLTNKECTHFVLKKSVCYLKGHTPSKGTKSKTAKAGICRQLEY